MKNKILFPIFFLLFLTSTNAQERNWQAGIFFSVDQMSLDYTYNDWFDEETSDPTSTHATLGIRLERKVNERWKLQGGLSFSNMKFDPNMYLPFFYGISFQIDDSHEFLSQPLLHQHEINILSVPLGIKYNFAPNKKWQPFASLNINTSINYKETEIYQEGFDRINEERKTLFIDDSEINLFNIGFDLEAGIQYQINSTYKIVFAPGIRLGEYRNGNEKFKRIGDQLYETQWLVWTRKKLGIGFLAAF